MTKRICQTVIFSWFLLLLPSLSSGEDLTLTTFYPSPYGVYERIQLVPRPAIGGTACDLGTLYVSETNGNILYLCQDDGSDGEWGLIPGVWTQSGDTIYLTDQSSPALKKVGIGLDDGDLPEFKLTLDHDGGILAKGQFGQGAVLTTSGSGTRLFWYPRKAVFRSGNVTGNQWNDINLGEHSVAFGKNNQATGNRSTITGGENHVLTANDATIAGGLGNTNTNSTAAAMAGGHLNQNLASGFSFIGGGEEIKTRGLYDTNIGGWRDDIKGNYSTSVRGYITNGNYDTIIAGASSGTGFGGHGTIVGGFMSSSSGNHSTVVGSLGTAITGNYATLVTHRRSSPWFIPINEVGNYAFMECMQDCNASGQWSTVLGVDSVSVLGDYATAGGCRADVYDSTSTNGGHYGFVGGGDILRVAGDYGTVVSGHANHVSHVYGFVGGGDYNYVFGDHATASGRHHWSQGTYSWAGGDYTRNSGARTFVWGHTTWWSMSLPTVSQNDAFVIQTGNMGIGTTAPAQKLHVNGNVRIDNGNLTIVNAPTVAGPDMKIDANGVVGLDLAEVFETSEAVTPGDLLVMDAAASPQLRKSHEAYDPKIVGVVSQAPAAVLKGDQLVLSPEATAANGITQPPVALAGRVRCKVSLENGPIAVGDLLTSSSVAGHAMKLDKASGPTDTMIGKAMEPFAGGPGGEKEGMITILLMR